MPILFETEWFVWKVENDCVSKKIENRRFDKGIWDRSDWTINEQSMERGLALLAQRCMEENLEIKSVLPLNGGRGAEGGGGGGGGGWGARVWVGGRLMQGLCGLAATSG